MTTIGQLRKLGIRPAVTFETFVRDAASLGDLVALIRANPGDYAGKVVGVLDGDYGTTPIDLSAINNSGAQITFYGYGYRTARWNGVDADNAHRISLTRLDLFGIRTPTGTNGENLARSLVVGASNASHIHITDCEIHSQPMETSDFNFYVKVAGNGNGLAFVEGETVTNQQAGTSERRANILLSQPRSAAEVLALANSDQLNSTSTISIENARWNGVTILGLESGATRVLSNPANISNVSFMAGVSGPASHVRIEDCDIHDLKWPFSGTFPDLSYQRNVIRDVFTNFGNLGVGCDRVVIRGNRGSDVWSSNTDGAPGTSGPHQSLWGFSVFGTDCHDVVFEGNVLAIGWRRSALTPTWWPAVKKDLSVTGPKQNDQGGVIQVTISGTTMTVTDVTSVLSGYPDSAPGVRPGMTIRALLRDRGGLGVSIPDGTRVVSQTSGTTNGVGVYELNQPATAPASSVIVITSRNINWTFRSNLLVSNGGICVEQGYNEGGEFAYNTVVVPHDQVGQTAGWFFHDNYAGTRTHHNVAVVFGQVGKPEFPNDDDFFAGAWDNLSVMSGEGHPGPAGYDGLFVGRGMGSDNWKRLDADQALIAFHPKPGGRIATGYGHAAYYNFDTNTADYPTVTAPATATATGVTLPGVIFEEADRLTWTATPTSNPLLGFPSGGASTVTFVVHFRRDEAGDGQDSLFQAAGVAEDYRMRVLATARITVKGTSGAQSAQIESSFPIIVGEENQWVVSFDFANFRYGLARNGVVDGFVSVTNWTGADGRTTGDTFTIANSDGGTRGAPGLYRMFAASDTFIDLNTATGLGKVWAQDGKPADPGADGSSLFGVAAKVLIHGNAATWNAGTNRGTCGDFVMTGSVTDA